MSNSLSDIDHAIRQKVYTQDYLEKSVVEGVKMVNLISHLGEDGDLSEIIKIDGDGNVEGFPGFKIAQINRTKLLPRSIKAWHLHSKQDDLWYVIPSNQLFVGLWDVRGKSKTNGKTMRVVLGGGNSQLLYIPHGVAHGLANFTEEKVELFYFTNQIFNVEHPDEQRIAWDAKSASFWMPKRD